MKKQILTFVFFTLASSLFATTYHVELSGNDILNDGSKEKPWASIAHAAGQADHGDTIHVGVGTYTEHSLDISKNIHIQGLGAEYTIIQAGDTKPSAGTGNVIFQIQAEVRISGLTIRHGSPGIRVVSSGDLYLTDCNVTDCYTETPGAGINVAGSLRMERSCVAYNESPSFGAGIYASRSTESLSEVVISNSTLSHNKSTGSNSMGGAMCITFGTLELRNSTLVFNSAPAKGKGLHINSSDALVKVFTNNIVAANGIPDIGANYATVFPAESDIDYNVISMAWAGYINFGENTVFNSSSDADTLSAFVDSIALQPLANGGSGVLANAIDENSLLVKDRAGSSATSEDVRRAPRSIPDIGAYEHIAQAPMTGLSILNSDTSVVINRPVRIAVAALPAYTTESYFLSLDPASEAQAQLKGDTLLASTLGMVSLWVTNPVNVELADTIRFSVTDVIDLHSINISLPTDFPSLFAGGQLQFFTNVLPKNATDTTVIWSVSAPDLASINQTGLFTAKAVGMVTVTATSRENPELKEQMEVFIVDNTPVELTVNAEYSYKTGIENPAGAVVCWLTDSDIKRPRKRSMETALSEMGAGALRFPYGALSNNYLWTKDPRNLVDGPEPCVAVPNRAPAGWDWAVDEQGFFKKDLGFDEYVALCRKIGAEPVVCVNIMSHVFNPDDEITIDTLIYYAREWVRYANITKGYGIKYWQLGNEQDHHNDIYPQAAFKSDYKKMAMAMLEVDPTIKTGPGLLNRWNDEMLRYCPEYVEFITCHQYLWFGGNEWEGYDAWKDYGKALIPHITDNLAYVRASSKPGLEIFVTETGITGGRYPDPQVFNLYKGLVLFEMQMEMIITSNVKNTFYWGTHTPWNGEDGDSPLATLFSNDSANENHMQADILSAINKHIQEDYIGKLSGSGIVTYSTISDNDSLMVVYALNKNRVPKNIRVSTQNTGSFKDLEKWVFAGNSEYDANAKFSLNSEGTLDEHTLETSLPPLSITILRMALNDDGGNTAVSSRMMQKGIKLYPNPAEDILHIEGAEAFEKNAALTITDMAGKICQRQNIFQTSVINISSLEPGVYTMQITEGNNNYSSVFIRR